jgi:hypothetical protein
VEQLAVGGEQQAVGTLVTLTQGCYGTERLETIGICAGRSEAPKTNGAIGIRATGEHKELRPMQKSEAPKSDGPNGDPATREQRDSVKRPPMNNGPIGDPVMRERREQSP